MMMMQKNERQDWAIGDNQALYGNSLRSLPCAMKARRKR